MGRYCAPGFAPASTAGPAPPSNPWSTRSRPC